MLTNEERSALIKRAHELLDEIEAELEFIVSSIKAKGD